MCLTRVLREQRLSWLPVWARAARVTTVLACLVLAGGAAVVGCGGSGAGPPLPADPSPAPESPAPELSSGKAPATLDPSTTDNETVRAPGSDEEPSSDPSAAAALPRIADEQTARDWDAGLLAAVGIRRLSGEHLTLFTDLPSDPAVDELPAAFDQAVPAWCAYFELPVETVTSWRMNGYLIKDQARFQRAGMLPDDLPVFLNGYQRGRELWLYEQPSSYYRRHLLLHEGTHGFMKWTLGGAGPPWYMEGTAELLATHRWVDGRLMLRYFPRDKREVPHWGRIKKIREELQHERTRTLQQIAQYDAAAHLEVAPYAWCWAAAAFLDGHPACQEVFRQMHKSAVDSSGRFSIRLFQRLARLEPRLSRQWQLFVHRIEYGYDLAREAIEPRRIVDLPEGGATVKVQADRGWQSTGFRLERGRAYRVEATGRFQIAQDSQPWWCEANGVTLRYHAGRPLGMLLAAVVDENERPGAEPLLAPRAIGHAAEFPAPRAGTLYLRINDSPAELRDNVGELAVTIARR